MQGERARITDAVVAGRDAPGWYGDKQERWHLWGEMFGSWLEAQTAALGSKNEELVQMILSFDESENDALPLVPESAAYPPHVEQLVAWCLGHGFAQPHSRGESM